jgi:hypothetical protein
MNRIQNYIEKNKVILKKLNYKRNDDSIELSLPNLNNKILLNKNNLINLLNNKLIKSNSNIEYYQNYGFSINNYAEFFIGSEKEIFYGIDTTYNIDLKFKINDFYIEIGPASQLSNIILLPFYSYVASEILESNTLDSLFSTIKIYNAPKSEHKALLVKSLYYINSYYMKRNDCCFSLFNIWTEEIEDSSLYDNDSSATTINRKRVRKRKDFKNIEPLILYNYATLQKEGNRFLSFYRVLEFFFQQAFELQISDLRKDKNITEKQLIEFIHKKNERNLLNNLIKKILTPSDKKKLINYLMSHNLLKTNNINKFSDCIYDYRNSIVHAKETQKDKIILPNIFEQNNETKIWNYVIKYLSEAAINRLNLM